MLLRILILGVFVWLFLFGNVHAFTVKLQWDPNTEPDLAGYKLYYGTASRNYSHTIDLGQVNSYQVDNLQDEVKYYFAVTAYDIDGNESGFSNEVSAQEVFPWELFYPAFIKHK